MSRLQDEKGLRISMLKARSIQSLLKDAEAVSAETTKAEIKKAQVLLNFLDLCESKGLGPAGFLDYLKDGIEMCKKNNDTRAMPKLLQLYSEIVLKSQPNIDKVITNVLNLTKNDVNIKDNAGPAGMEDIKGLLQEIAGGTERPVEITQVDDPDPGEGGPSKD